MKRRRISGLIVLILCISLFSFIAIEKIKQPGEFHPINLPGDSTHIDSLQILVNNYCNINTSIDSLTKIIEFKKSVDNDLLNRIANFNKDLLNYRSSRKSIEDTILNDTLKKSKIAHYDSLIGLTIRKIAILKKLISGNELGQLDKIRVIKQTLLQSVNYNLKIYTSKITGSRSVVYYGVSYRLFVTNMDSDVVRIHLPRPKHPSSLGNIKEILESQNRKPLMITNAGMFTTSFEPEGLYIEENSQKKYELDVADHKSHLNFYLRPNGVFYITNKNIPCIDTTQEFARLQKSRKFKVKLATQSGPMLVINGRIHPAFVKGSHNRKIRSGVGIISPKKMVFAATLKGSNFYDFAVFFKDVFNCNNALFLDGAISKMYLHDIDSTETGGQFGPILSVSKRGRK